MATMQERIGKVAFKVANIPLRKNLDDLAFTNEVDILTQEVYADIGQIVLLPLDSLFMLLAIKTFYIDRKHNNPDTINYIGNLLNRFASADSAPWEVRRFREKIRDLENMTSSVKPLYMMDILLSGETNPQTVRALHQYIADHSLFWAGTYPDADPSTSGFGESCYHTLSCSKDIPPYDRKVFSDLSSIFSYYVDGINDLARNFLHAPNKKILLDLMLSSITLSKDDDPLIAAKAEGDAIAYAKLLHYPDPFTRN